MNALLTNVQGKRVVIGGRVFECKDGFGCFAFPSGTEISGTWCDTHRDGIVDGMTIESFDDGSIPSVNNQASFLLAERLRAAAMDEFLLPEELPEDTSFDFLGIHGTWEESLVYCHLCDMAGELVVKIVDSNTTRDECEAIQKPWQTNLRKVAKILNLTTPLRTNIKALSPNHGLPVPQGKRGFWFDWIREMKKQTGRP